MEQEVSLYLDLKASSPLTPSVGKCRADNASSSEIFSEETLNRASAPGTPRGMMIRQSTAPSGSMPSHRKRKGPGAANVPGFAGLALQHGRSCSQLCPFS